MYIFNEFTSVRAHLFDWCQFMRECSGFHISHWYVVTQSFPQCQVAVCSELVWGGLWLNLKCRESGIVWTLEIVNPASIGPSTTTWWQDVISKSKRKSSAFLVRLRPDLWSVIGDAFHVPAFVFVAFLLIGSAQREKTWRKIKLFASEDPGARNQKTKSRSHNWFLNPNSITIHHNAPKTSKDYEGRPFNHLNLKSSKLQGPQPYVAELRALFTQTVRLSELHVNVAFASI